MNVQLTNEDIVAAVTRAVEAKLPGQKVERVQFTRNKGGGVRADVTTADKVLSESDLAAARRTPEVPVTFDAP